MLFLLDTLHVVSLHVLHGAVCMKVTDGNLPWIYSIMAVDGQGFVTFNMLNFVNITSSRATFAF